MNVFEYLGLKADHREESKIVQKVRHLSEVPESRRVWPAYAQVKKDGVFCLVVVYGGIAMLFSRTGKLFQNTAELTSEINMSGFKDGVYVAELCNSHISLEVLSGMVNPNRNKPLSEEKKVLLSSNFLWFHDYLSLEDFTKGYTEREYLLRNTDLVLLLPIGTGSWSILPLTVVKDEEEFLAFSKACINNGEEGAVGKPSVSWESGHKGWRSFKEVRGVDYDLKCVGVEEGTGKYKGLAANLLFNWKGGKIIRAMLGKGWTHDDAKAFFLFPPIGNIFQVYALQESSKGVLRLPKVGELRHDKSESDA